MQPPFCKHATGQQGFSLIEVLLALGIVVFTLVTLIALLAMGIETARDSRDDSVQVFIADTVRSKLLADENWPVSASTAMSTNPSSLYSYPLYFDNEGIETTNASSSVYTARLVFMPSPNLPYVSPRLDYVTLAISRTADTNRVLSEFTLQRARLTPRTWN